MRSLALFALGITFFSSAESQTAAGITPGSFRVTETGAAEYRIPIRVPPGIAGLEPKLALVYNSQAANGLLGLGWTLEGLSSITRCPRTVAQDGVRGGINYNSDDRFCLDGQRLMTIGGVYGADGTEYRTERETFSKVISYGVAGSGPAWFKLWTKSGQILEYGNKADSRIEAQGSASARAWALNRLGDTKGNYLRIAYAEDNSLGDYYPSRIDYAAGAEAQPSRSVRFVYQRRPDVTPLYVAGSLIRSRDRMSAVRTYVDETLVEEYRVAYGASPVTGNSRIASLTVCDGTGACLSPTTLGYAPGTAGLEPTLLMLTGHPLHNSGAGVETYVADFNGDGRLDVLRAHGSDAAYNILFYGSASGFSGGVLVLTGHPLRSADGTTRSYIGDFNGDGKADVLRGYGDPAYNIVFYGTESGFSAGDLVLTGHPLQAGDGNTATYIGDFNGDGRADVLRGYTDPAWNSLWYSTGNGFSDAQLVLTGHPLQGSNGATQTYVADFDGDGKADVLRGYVNPAWNALWYSTGNGFSETRLVLTGHPLQGGSTQSYVADFNGDGRADVLRGYIDPSSNALWLSTGTGFTETKLVLTGHPLYNGDGNTRSYVGDFNGDGKADVLRGYADPAWNSLWYSTGDGFSETQLVLTGHPLQGGNGGTLSYAGDFDGDGKADLLRGYVDPAYNALWYAARPNSEIVQSVAGGWGAALSITYRPLTDDSVYAKAPTPASYPLADVRPPLYVVSLAPSSSGLGDASLHSHTYGGARSSAERGFLGFGWTESTQQSSGIKSRSEFRQDWPYAGLPSLVRRTRGSGALLSQTANTYGCTNLAPGAACTVAAGNRYFSFLSQSVEAGADVSGAALPEIMTTSQYDQYGNATSVIVSTGDGHSKSTANVFADGLPGWALGRLTRSTVQSTSP